MREIFRYSSNYYFAKTIFKDFKLQYIKSARHANYGN